MADASTQSSSATDESANVPSGSGATSDLEQTEKLVDQAKFVTFEGGEGVGKSTQVKLLMERLKNEGVNVVRTREPGGTAKAEAIRSFILSGQPESWGAGAEAVLFAAARLDHVDQLIAPNLADGNWVISDRFHDSTRAYQGLTGGTDPKLIESLEQLALHETTPDLTIILDMDPQKAFERVEQRALEEGVPISADRFERENLDWHRSLRQAFLDIAEANPDRCVLLSADEGEDALSQQIWETVAKRFSALQKPDEQSSEDENSDSKTENDDPSQKDDATPSAD